ncbi:MAG: geranylgeranyl reductase family protein [Saprospiraceae bacterium]|jgi:geranylgeranyl reductase family protein
MDIYDIAIVGAGPSGCACALALQGSGLRVVLLDKDIFPRDKICGDAIPGPAFKAMDQINPKWGKAMREFADKETIRTSKIFAPNGKNITQDWVSYSYNSKRLDFDNFLLQLVHSETTIKIEYKRLQQVCVEDDGVQCHFKEGSSLKASLVIGCDGANSIVRRQLDPSTSSEKPGGLAVRSYYTGVEGVEAGVNEFHFFKGYPGYFWIFPLANGYTNVGFGISQEKKALINLRDSLHQIITTAPSIAPRFKNGKAMENTKGFALPIWSEKKVISGDRFLLCGDAASLIDPLQGHGIDKAMWSGLLAAKQAISCFKSADFSAKSLSQYDQQVYDKVGAELSRNSTIMHSVIRFPWMINAAAWVGKYKKLTQWVAHKLKI